MFKHQKLRNRIFLRFYQVRLTHSLQSLLSDNIISLFSVNLPSYLAFQFPSFVSQTGQLSDVSTQTAGSLQEINRAIAQLGVVAQGLYQGIARFQVSD